MLRSLAQSLPGPVTREKLPSSILPRRLLSPFLGLLFLAVIALLALLSHLRYFSLYDPYDPVHFLHGLPKPEAGPNPPRFLEWYQREKRLPQHNLDLPYPQGRDGRYIRFANQGTGVGWGNVMHEVVMNAYLAYLSKRIYAFENYTWDKGESDFSKFKGKPIPARVPLTALLSGPVAGDPFPPSADSPPSVNAEFFTKVCPNPTIINRDQVNNLLPGASAATLVQAWVDKLEQVEDRCVEIRHDVWPVFDLWMVGDSTRLLDIWPSLSTSPMLTHFSWSPLIIAALVANAHVIHPSLSSATSASFMPSSNPGPLPGLLALHVRRGDYIEHCINLANWGAGYMGFNEFPGFPDRFTPPTVSSQGDEALKEKLMIYNPHCFPQIDQIVSRVREVRASLLQTTKLTRVYVLSNGRPKWISELKDALKEDAREQGLGEWEHIGTTRDLRLTREQKHNSQVLDMAVASRAEVFIGTGFSSMTSNSNMLRASHGHPWNTSHFW